MRTQSMDNLKFGRAIYTGTDAALKAAIDSQKKIFDSMGHLTGDCYLKTNEDGSIDTTWKNGKGDILSNKVHPKATPAAEAVEGAILDGLNNVKNLLAFIKAIISDN